MKVRVITLSILLGTAITLSDARCRDVHPTHMRPSQFLGNWYIIKENTTTPTDFSGLVCKTLVIRRKRAQLIMTEGSFFQRKETSFESRAWLRRSEHSNFDQIVDHRVKSRYIIVSGDGQTCMALYHCATSGSAATLQILCRTSHLPESAKASIETALSEARLTSKEFPHGTTKPLCNFNG